MGIGDKEFTNAPDGRCERCVDACCYNSELLTIVDSKWRIDPMDNGRENYHFAHRKPLARRSKWEGVGVITMIGACGKEFHVGGNV